MTLKNIFKEWKVILLLIVVLLALVSIKPQFFGSEGVSIRSVQLNSSASVAGIANPNPQLPPLAKERILKINSQSISSVEEYQKIIESLITNKTIRVETNKGTYTLLPREEEGQIQLGMMVQEAPSSNLRKGLDLAGGTRVVLRPAERLSAEDLEATVDILKERLNVFGLSDVVVRQASDLAGGQFIVIEIAGVTEDEVQQLLARQGKFEAAISNETVFFGGKKDVTYVCRSADCSGIDPNYGCTKADGGGYGCRFFFTITLSPEAAERQAALTKESTIIPSAGGSYLSDDLVLFLDDQEVDRLRIGAELQGRASTNIQISGGGSGRTIDEARMITLQEMKRLQTILITGSLPVKFEVVKLDTISPALGKEFLQNIILAGLAAIAGVVAVVALRYRKLKIIIPMSATLLSEIVMILGFAALVGWNLDLAALAGIIIVAGTAVDHLIVITDETVLGEGSGQDWKRKVKAAMFIVMGAYFTTLSGMIPLWFAGAGLLKGFAFTSIAGLSFGVLIARPAYAAMIKHLM